MQGRSVRLLITAALIALLVFALQRNNFGKLGDGDRPLSYTQFRREIGASNVTDGEFDKDTFRGRYANKPAEAHSSDFVVNLPNSANAQAELEKALLEKAVPFRYTKPLLSDFMTGILFSVMLPIGFIALLYFFFMRQAQSGGNQALSFGRSRARRVTDNVPKVTFEDVAGVDEAKHELVEVVDFLRNARKFQALGAKIPKGVLLLGPPGCGKTLLARAIAGEAGVPFFHISGSDFVEMFVGVGASRVRDLFDTAKASRPALIFIDEIDAVGRQRGAGLGGGHDEREQTLNQLLVEMDGFDPNAGIILIAATNRPDVLDPALLRPGRFDRRVVVDAPDIRGREQILRVHLRGKPLQFAEVEADMKRAVEELSRRTPGFTGADLANVINEAALLAARNNQTVITMGDFDAAIDRVIMGPERRSRLLTEAVRRRTAYHEAGHAVVGELLEHSDPVSKVSIMPRGMALGFTLSLPIEDRYTRTKNQIDDTIACFMAGRVAEMIEFGDMDNGAANDLDRATDMARAMVCEYGMSERLGPVRLGRRHGSPFLGRDIMEDRDYSEDVARAIDEEVRSIISSNYERARLILIENRDAVGRIVTSLLENETIDRDEFLQLMGSAELPAALATEPRAEAASGAVDQRATTEI